MRPIAAATAEAARPPVLSATLCRGDAGHGRYAHSACNHPGADRRQGFGHAPRRRPGAAQLCLGTAWLLLQGIAEYEGEPFLTPSDMALHGIQRQTHRLGNILVSHLP